MEIFTGNKKDTPEFSGCSRYACSLLHLRPPRTYHGSHSPTSLLLPTTTSPPLSVHVLLAPRSSLICGLSSLWPPFLTHLPPLHDSRSPSLVSLRTQGHSSAPSTLSQWFRILILFSDVFYFLALTTAQLFPEDLFVLAALSRGCSSHFLGCSTLVARSREKKDKQTAFFLGFQVWFGAQ